MLYIAQNLRFLRKQKRISQALLAKQIGVVPGTISNYENGTSKPDFEQLEKIIKFLDVSAHDLLYTNLESERNFKTKGAENVIKENDNRNDNIFDNKQKLHKTLSNDEEQIQQMTPVILEMPEGAVENAVAVPVLPVEAAAGSGAFNMDYHEDVDTLLLPKSFLSPTRRARYCIDVRGESMEPTLMDRTRLVIRQLDRAEWGTIRDGAVYVVTDCDGKTFVKRIRNRLKERGVLRLMSDNPDHDQYKTFELSETEILHVWKIELYIADQMPPTARRSGGIRAELDTLRDRLDELESLLR